MRRSFVNDKFTARFIHGSNKPKFYLGDAVYNSLTDDNGTTFHFEGKSAVVTEINTQHVNHKKPRYCSMFSYVRPIPDYYCDSQFTFQVVENINPSLYPETDSSVTAELLKTAIIDIARLKRDVAELQQMGIPQMRRQDWNEKKQQWENK